MSIRIKSSITAIVAGLMLAGCVSVGPDYQPPSLNTVQLAAQTVALQAETEKLHKVESNWWQNFNDALLSELMAIAHQHNPSVAAAQANLTQALAIFDDVEDNDWPTGGVTGNFTAQRQVVPGIPNASQERITVRSRQLGLSAGWEVDIVGKLVRAEEAANANAEAAYFAWQEARLALLSNVASTYVQYRGLQTRLVVAEETLTSLSRTQSVVNSQVEAGYASKLDELRVKGQIAAVEAVLPALSAQTEAARQVLIALAGGEQQLAEFDWSPTQIPSLSQPVALADSVDFLQHRPDVRAAERQLAAATAAIGVAEADLYPSLSLTGFLGFFSTQGSVLGGDAKAWSIAPSINWQALDLDSVRARIRAADAGKDASLANFEQTVLTAISEANTSLSNYTQLQRRLHALDQQVSASEEALDLAQFQFKNGAIDLLDLLDVERQWLSSRDQRVAAEAEMTQALIAIYTALGGGILNVS